MEDYQEQHAIPQQISAYQFRLVGDMTLRQFFQLAGGALVSLLIYSTNLPVYIKWPLILISFLIGVALAFFPLQDRPLAKWFELFFKAIYSPTLFIWKKTAVQRVFYQPEEAKSQAPQLAPEPEPQTTIKTKAEPQTPSEEMQKAQSSLERTEVEFLSKVSTHLGPTKQRDAQLLSFQAVPTTQQPSTIPGKPEELKVPKTKTVATDKKGLTDEELEKKIDSDDSVTPSVTRTVQPFAEKEKTKEAQAATFTPEASPPIPPTTPNIIVGQVLDQDGKIVESAILEITNQYGRSVRALKSNKLGHFMIVTPLQEGKYEMKSEKEGFEFDPITIEAKGEIIPPIAITAKSITENKEVVENVAGSEKPTSLNLS